MTTQEKVLHAVKLAMPEVNTTPYLVREDKYDGTVYNVYQGRNLDQILYTVQVWEFDDGVLQFTVYDGDNNFIQNVAIIPFEKYEVTNITK